MGNLSTDVADRAMRFFGVKPGDKLTDDRRAEVRKVMWWMVESDAVKAARPQGPLAMAKLMGHAIPELESPIEVLLAVEMAKCESIARRFAPQYSVGPYRLDFGFQKVKLGVECDGANFHREPAQVKRDQQRDSYLSKLGWNVIRFMGWEIRRSPAECVARIARYHRVLLTLG